MSWKKSLITFLGAGSALIRSGIALFLGLLFLISVYLTYAMFYSVDAETGKPNPFSSAFGVILCIPITLIILLLLLVSIVWAFSGIKSYLHDVEREDKKK